MVIYSQTPPSVILSETKDPSGSAHPLGCLARLGTTLRGFGPAKVLGLRFPMPDFKIPLSA